MKKIVLLIFAIGLLISCRDDRFERLGFIEEVIVETLEAEKDNNSVKLSGRFLITGPNGFSKNTLVKYGLILGNQADLSDGVIIQENESDLLLAPNIDGVEFFTDVTLIDDIETGVRYYFQAFVEIGGRPFPVERDIKSFIFNWLPDNSWSTANGPARANALVIPTDNSVYIIGGKNLTTIYTDIWERTTQDDQFALVASNLPSKINNQSSLVGFQLGDFINVGLGVDKNGTLINDFFRATINANTLEFNDTLPSFPIGREGAITFSMGDRAFVGMGEGAFRFFNDLWEYNEAQNQWNALPIVATDTIAGRSDAISFLINNTLFVGLGRAGQGPMTDLWSLDLSGTPPLSWRQKSNFPGTPRSEAVVVVLKGKAFVGMGVGTSGLEKDFYTYDPSTDQWTFFTEFPGSLRSGAIGFTLGQKGFIGMGLDERGLPLSDFWEFDIE